jgi:hypothetical protein
LKALGVEMKIASPRRSVSVGQIETQALDRGEQRQDKVGTGWLVIVRYHAGHERRIDGFATEREALDWIIANSKEVEK